jgi:glutaconate CoA-transferase subunit B
VLPLSIGDGELAETAACVVPLPEIFSYYLQGGRVDVGFLGAAQIDRYGNLNSTVIGEYAQPATRLPGAGGAPEIAAHAGQTFIVMKASRRSFVERIDFRTSAGHFDGRGGRARSGARGAGPRAVITDFGILTPDQESDELVLTALYAGVEVEEAQAAVGWSLTMAKDIVRIPVPYAHELSELRALHARTDAAHRRAVELPI